MTEYGPFDPDELVRWAENYGHPEGWAKKAQALHGQNEAMREAWGKVDPGWCREEIDGTTDRCGKPAEFVLWGKLLAKEAFGPRCYVCAAKHVGPRALGDPSWAIVDLRPMQRALKARGT